MKVILEPTEDQSKESHPYDKISIESPHDDMRIDEAMDLVHRALVAWGFSRETINDYEAGREYENETRGSPRELGTGWVYTPDRQEAMTLEKFDKLAEEGSDEIDKFAELDYRKGNKVDAISKDWIDPNIDPNRAK